MGFVIAQERLGPGRIHHCMRWLGVAQRAFEMMCSYANEREMFGSTLARKANIQDWVAESPRGHPGGAADDVARGVEDRHRGRRRGARGDRPHQVLRRQACCTASSTGPSRSSAPPGVTEDHPLSMFYRQARLARIYDGPDEVHKMVVARRILARHASRG